MKILDRLKALYRDKKKRPWLIGGAGATAVAAYMTMRAPGPGPEAAAENAAADRAAPPSEAGFDQGMPTGDGMFGTYVSSPPMDYDSSFEEMDYGPVLDAMAEHGEQLEAAVATQITGEQTARKRAVSAVKKVNRKQQQQIAKQRESLRKQRRELAKVRRRVREGPKPKPKPKKRGQ